MAPLRPVLLMDTGLPSESFDDTLGSNSAMDWYLS